MIRTRKALIFIVVVLGLIAYQIHHLSAQPPRWRDEVRLDLTNGASARVGWYTFSQDTAVTQHKLVTFGSFTQLSVADTLRIRSSSTADSTNLVLIGVLSADSTRFREKLRVSGTDSVWSAKKWLHFEQAVADTESAGTVTIYGKTTGALAIIVPGHLKSYAAHRYFGKLDGGIWGWAVNPDTTSKMMDVALRWYPDAADAGQTPETGYVTLDEYVYNVAAGTSGRPYTRTFSPPIFILRNGYLSAVASIGSGSTGGRVSVSIWGYDNK